VAQVFNLLAESVRQPGKSAHRHPHGKVGAFNVARGDVAGIRPSRDRGGLRSKANRRAVSHLFLSSPVDFNQRGVVDVAAESALDGFQVNLEPIGCQLHAIGEANPVHKGLVMRLEDWRWSSNDNFASDKASAGRPIPIDDARLPLGYRTGEKTLVRTGLSAATS
jgi:hypothetical protein